MWITEASAFLQGQCESKGRNMSGVSEGRQTMPVWLEPRGPEKKEQANLARTQQLDDPRPVGQTLREMGGCSRT